MALVCGLDIGSRTITGVVLSGRPGNYRLIDYFVEEIPSIETGQASASEDGEYDTPQSLDEFLRGIITKRKLDQAEIVGAVDTKDCIVREFRVPFVKDDQIAKTMLFEAETHFAGLDLDDYLLEYVKLAEYGDKSHLLVWALAKDRIRDRLATFRAAKLDPISLDIDAAALFNAYAVSTAYEEDATCLLLDMGKASTRLVVVEKGKIAKVRSLRLATSRVVKELPVAEAVGAATGGGGTSEPQVSVEFVDVLKDGEHPSIFDDSSIEQRFREIEAALQKIDPEGAGADRIAEAFDAPIAILSDDEYDRVSKEGEEEAALAFLEDDAADDEVESTASEAERPTQGSRGRSESLDRLASRVDEEAFDFDDYLRRIGLELQRSLVSMRLSSPVERICLTGGMSQNPGARSYFEEEFGVETVALEFGDALPMDIEPARREELSRLGAVAVGLGLKAVGADRVGLDFRKGPFRYEHKLERIRFPLLVAAGLFFLFSLQAVFWAIQEWKFERNVLAGYEEQSRFAYKTFFEQELIEGRQPLAAANAQKAAWEGKGGARSTRYIPAIEALHNVAQLLHDTKEWFELSNMTFNFGAEPVRSRSAAPGAGPPAKGGAAAPKLKAPTKSTIALASNDNQLAIKIRAQFRTAASKFFDVEINQPHSRDELQKYNLELVAKDECLATLK